MEQDSERAHKPGRSSPRTNFDVVSTGSLRRTLLLDALQHPATLLPFAVCVMAALYWLLVSPIAGGGRVAVVLLGVAGLVALAGFVWRYVIRYEAEYARRAQELLEILELEEARLRAQDVGRLRAEVHFGFSDIGSDEGMNALIDLSAEYEQLQPEVAERRDSDPTSISAVPSLAAEAYRQGLNVLSAALRLMKAAQSPGKERLEREIAALQGEIEVLRGDGPQAERLRLKEDTLASRRDRLKLQDELQLRVERLLYQAGQCEAALHRTWVEMAAIRSGGTGAGVDAVTEALRRTIRQVKEVQEEMRKLGY